MSELTDQEVTLLLGMTKNSLAQLAQAVHVALADDKMTPMEIFMLSTQAVPAVMPIVSAFRGLTRESIGQLIRVLTEGNLVLMPHGTIRDGS